VMSRRISRLTDRQKLGCSAWSHMDQLGYLQWHEEASKRKDKQTYCAVCKLACWPEEQKHCRKFKVDHDLESFYAAELAK